MSQSQSKRHVLDCKLDERRGGLVDLLVGSGVPTNDHDSALQKDVRSSVMLTSYVREAL